MTSEVRRVEQTVYGDLLFFVNFCMDFQCLFLTARLLRRPFFVGRGVLFSALGALYACVALFLLTGGFMALCCDLAVCALMCVGVFATKGQKKRGLLIPFGVYFGVSAAVGGVMSGMASLLSRLDLPPVESGTQVSSLAFFFLAALGGLATFLWARFCQRRAKGARATLTLTLAGETLTVRGLVDTANLLHDPVSGRPVVILEQSAANRWLPALFPRAARAPASILASLPVSLARHARLLPTKTVVGEGLMLALIPDAALLDAGRGERAVELMVSAAPLGGAPEDCQALLPAVLITE